MKQLLTLALLLAAINSVFAQLQFAKYVNPFIGTGGHGHTYPGATLPHGMVQLSPDTRLDGWDGCGGYHYSDNYIYGFSHTHLSGTGVSDYGDILVMPMNGKPSPDNKIYGSRFSHGSESATAGYYKVLLADDNIQAEFTATERTGFHHYIFSSAADNNLILDLKHRDEVIESSINIEDSVTISGLRRSKAWANDQYVYFVMKFSKPITHSGIWQNDQVAPELHNANGKNLKAWFQFDLSDSKDLLVKVAISAVSVLGAKKNLAAENPDWDFNAVKINAEKKWNTALSAIEVEGDEDKKTIFYTALYHTAVVPNVNMDVDGQYRGRDLRVHTATGFTNYSVFSLWDTYRAANPLYTIIDQGRTLDYIKTFLVQYQQGGRLPVWELASCETDCMIGYHSIPVIVDAYMKGIRGFDANLALEAMKKSATWNHLGLPSYISNGVISMDDEHESVSKTLEYAYDDWCIAQFAKASGKQDDYETYIRRAQYYKNILDTKTGFMRPRQNGGWLSPFDPREVNTSFTEANSWQYSFYFPQDIAGYLQLMGGREKLGQKLDSLFSAPALTTGRDQSDITGLIGQYAHGNEPSHHIIYLYNFAGKPYKTQQLIHRVMNEFYKNSPDGLIGNEDCGQMSAWYVLSALGFYPVTPGSTQYLIGTPAFKKATIHLGSGKSFTIRADAAEKDACYIAGITLNGRPHNLPAIDQADLMNGGNLNFQLSANPSMKPREVIALPEIGAAAQIVLNPVVNGGGVSFTESKTVSIIAPQKDATVYFTLDGSTPTAKSTRYTKALKFLNTTELKAVAIGKNNVSSFITTAYFKKSPHNWSIKLSGKYEQQYDGGGNNGLIDGIYGSTNWRKGNWQGYQKVNPEFIIDLKKTISVSTVTAGFLQDSRAWIIVPKQLIIETSVDGQHFTEVYKAESFLPADNLDIQVKKIVASFPATRARYVKITAVQFGKMPAWSEGAGGDTHIFADEIVVE